MEVRGIGDELREPQISFYLQCRQVEPIRVGALRGIRVDELIVAPGLRIQQPVAFHVVAVAVLIVNARRHRPTRCRRPDERQSIQHGFVEIGILLIEGQGCGIDAVDVAAVAPVVPNSETRPQRAVDQRAARGNPALIARRTTLRVRHLLTVIKAIGGQTGLGGNVAHGSAHRARSEKSSLRSAQHFDAVDIKRFPEGRHRD